MEKTAASSPSSKLKKALVINRSNRRIFFVISIVFFLLVLFTIAHDIFMRKRSSSSQPSAVSSQTADKKVFDQLLNNPNVITWNILALGKVEAIQDTVITIGTGTNAITFQTDPITQFYTLPYTPYTVGGTTSYFTSFSPSYIHKGDTIRVSFQMINNVLKISMITLLKNQPNVSLQISSGQQSMPPAPPVYQGPNNTHP